jgi:large subunit ribosomal protein L21
MFAVIKAGGKQFRVATDDVIQVNRLAAEAGDIVTFPVLMLGGENGGIGTPMVAGASVAAEVVSEGRGPKVIAFKKRRRKHSKRKRGYRDTFTVLRITEILTDGKEPAKAAKPKPVAKAKAPDEAAAPAKAKAKAKAPARKPAAKKAPAAKSKKK